MASPAACTTARWLLLLAVVAIVATRIIAIADARDPDRDMAMLMTNVPLASMADYLRPLPYYEQTTPLGHLFLIDMLSRLFGTEGMARFLAVRTVSAVAGLAALGLIALVYRRFTRSGELALILLLSAMSLQMMVFSVSEKPYIYGQLSSALLLWLGLRYADGPTRGRVAALIGGGAFAALFDFAAPVIVTMIGSGLLVHFLLRLRQGTGTWHDIRRLLFTGILTIAPALVLYVTYTRPMAYYDLVAYAVSDATAYLRLSEGLSSHNIRHMTMVVKIFAALSDPPYLLNGLRKVADTRGFYGVIYVALVLLGLFHVKRRSPLIAGAAATGFLTIALLNVLLVLQITTPSHFLFLVPLLVPLLGIGLARVLGRLGAVLPAPARALPLAMAVLCLSVGGIVRSANLDLHRISGHLARIQADPAPVWIYYNLQPSFTALNLDLPELLGLIPYETDETAWSLGARADNLDTIRDDYFTRAAAALDGRDRAYLLFDNFMLLRRNGGLQRFVDIAEAAIGPCTRYTDTGTVLLDCRKPQGD